jgi:hypothetical protein
MRTDTFLKRCRAVPACSRTTIWRSIRSVDSGFPAQDMAQLSSSPVQLNGEAIGPSVSHRDFLKIPMVELEGRRRIEFARPTSQQEAGWQRAWKKQRIHT